MRLDLKGCHLIQVAAAASAMDWECCYAQRYSRLFPGIIPSSLYHHPLWSALGFSGGAVSTCQCRRHGLDPWIRKIPWRRKWQSTPVFLPGESYGQRSLVGDCPWGCERVRQDWAAEHTHTLHDQLHSPHFSEKKTGAQREVKKTVLWWMAKENVVHIHNGTLLSHKEEWNNAFVATWMDLEIIITSEVNQTKINIMQHHFYVESRIWHKWNYLPNRNRLTNIEKRLVVAKGEEGGGGMDWEFEIRRCKDYI